MVDPVNVYDIGFFKAGVFGDVAAKPAEGKGCFTVFGEQFYEITLGHDVENGHGFPEDVPTEGAGLITVFKLKKDHHPGTCTTRIQRMI